MVEPKIGRRSRSLSLLAAGFVVAGFISLGLAARAQDRSTKDETIAALNDLESAIDELIESRNLMANAGKPYKQVVQRAASVVTDALDLLDWLTDHAGGEVWGPGVECSQVNLGIARGDLEAAVGTDGLKQFGLRGALATTTLGISADATTVSSCNFPANVVNTAAGDLIDRSCPAGQTATATPHQAESDAPAR